MTLSVYTNQPAPRLTYILDFLCRRILGCEYVLYNDTTSYLQAPAPRLNYSPQRISTNECLIIPQGLLKQQGLQPQAISVFLYQQLPAFFASPTSSPADIPFDLFAASFYLVSRYEEYLVFQPDKYGRFTADQSLAGKEAFLQLPVIDLWVEKLKTILQKQNPEARFPSRSYQFLPSYDIDMAWAYLHKGLLRYTGGLFRAIARGNVASFWGRLLVKAGAKEDPFYTFAYMDDLHKRFRLAPLYFFLLGDYGPFDQNIAPQNTSFRQLIRQLAAQYATGLHPSFASFEKPEVLDKEKTRLEKITGTAVLRSRQHYLRLSFPTTYRQLIAQGIGEDYTMGYAENIGFRAGTCTAFQWYDLEQEQATQLKVFPFTVMDVTLKEYLRLAPEEAVAKVAEMIAVVRQVGGTFCTLWHNSSLSEIEGWEGWRMVYEKILAAASDEVL